MTEEKKYACIDAINSFALLSCIPALGTGDSRMFEEDILYRRLPKRLQKEPHIRHQGNKECLRRQKQKERQLKEKIKKRDGYQTCCNHCRYLLPQEEDQTEAKEPHICTVFNTRVYHMPSRHPAISRLDACIDIENTLTSKRGWR